MKLKPKPLRDLANLSPPPFLFQDFVRDYAITQIAADPYTGKSMLCIYMAICADQQRALFDKFAPLRPHQVLYIGPDSPEWDYGQQSMKIMRGMNMDAAQRKTMSVEIHTDQDIDIMNPELQRSIEEYHKEKPFSLLMIDTLLDIHPYNPSDAQMMKLVMQQLKRMRDKYGCAIVFANHIPKFAGFTREAIQAHAGSFKIAGSSDFQFILKRKGNRVYLGWGKQRGQMADVPLTYFEMVDHEVVEDGKPYWGVQFVVPQADRNSLILDFITRNGPSDRHQVGAHLKSVLLQPDNTPLSAAQALRAADNGFQALKLLGKIKSEGGKWTLA